MGGGHCRLEYLSCATRLFRLFVVLIFFSSSSSSLLFCGAGSFRLRLFLDRVARRRSLVFPSLRLLGQLAFSLPGGDPLEVRRRRPLSCLSCTSVLSASSSSRSDFSHGLHLFLLILSFRSPVGRRINRRPSRAPRSPRVLPDVLVFPFT